MEEHHKEATMQEGHEQEAMMKDSHMPNEGMEDHDHGEMHGQGEMKHDEYHGEMGNEHHDKGPSHKEGHHQEMKMDHHDESHENEEGHHEMKDEHHQEMKMDHHEEGHEYEEGHHAMEEMKDEHHHEEGHEHEEGHHAMEEMKDEHHQEMKMGHHKEGHHKMKDAHHSKEHDHNDYSHDEGDSHDHGDMEVAASGGNVFQLGDRTFVLEPLLDISGLFKLALRTPEAAYIQLSVTSPSGVEKLMTIQSDTAVFELGEFEEGLWHILAGVGDYWLETSILAQKQTSDFDSEVVLFLTPAPDVARGGKTEAFVYGFGDGDNLHKRFTMQTSMQGMAESMESADVDLVHNHFMDMYNSEDFTPMANTASLDLSLPGLWNVVVNIIGGFSETATFKIKVEN